MKSIVVAATIVLVGLCAALFGPASSASASHVELQLAAPAEVLVGNAVDVRAALRSADDGLPIVGATVTFFMEVSFDGVGDRVELGNAVTGKDGVAVLSYVPRSAGEHEIQVEYLTPGSAEPEVASWTHSAIGASQLYRSRAGIQVPGLNVWLVIAVVAAVWIILLSVILRVIAIARAGDDADVADGSASAGQTRAAATDSGVVGSS